MIGILIISFGVSILRFYFSKTNTLILSSFSVAISSLFIYFCNQTNSNYFHIPFKNFNILLMVIMLLFTVMTNFNYLVKRIINLKQCISVKNILITCLLLFFYNISVFWPIHGWDTQTLYDFKAKLYVQGLGEDQINKLSLKDVYNPTYYLSYPPLLSTVHGFYYSLGINPIEFHFILLVSIIMCVYVITNRFFKNTTHSLFFTLLFALNPIINQHVVYGYSNLPYAYFYLICTSIFILTKDFGDSFGPYALMGIISAGLKLTRWVEPFYLLPLFLYIFFDNRKSLIKKTILFFLSFIIIKLLILHWETYLSTFSKEIFINTNIQSTLELIKIGISFNNIYFVSKIFILKMFKNYLFIVTSLIIGLADFVLQKPTTNKLYYFFNILIVIVLTYFGSIYLYFKMPDRPEIFDSLDRLFIFLIPICWLYIISVISDYKKSVNE